MGKWDKLLEQILRGTGDANVPFDDLCHWSVEDDTFVAEMPELPGCMAHGATQEEALGNAKQAAQLWIDTAREFGDPVPEPRGRRLVFA